MSSSSSTATKRSLSSLLSENDDSNRVVPPTKRQRSSTFKADVIKAHAKFARAFTVNGGVDGTDQDHPFTENSPSPRLVAKLWSKKTAAQRKKVLGQVHVSAERLLRARGVWDGVARILDRHYTSSLGVTAAIAAPIKAVEQVSQAEAATEMKKATADPEFPASASTPLPAEACLSSVAETARALAQTVSLATMNAVAKETTREEPILPISLVPNPLQKPVPNPLEEEKAEDVVPLEIVSAFPVLEPTDPYTVPPPPPVSVVSLPDLGAPESPLSDWDSSRRGDSPDWCMNEITFFAHKAEPWQFDPLQLLS